MLINFVRVGLTGKWEEAVELEIANLCFLVRSCQSLIFSLQEVQEMEAYSDLDMEVHSELLKNDPTDL